MISLSPSRLVLSLSFIFIHFVPFGSSFTKRDDVCTILDLFIEPQVCDWQDTPFTGPVHENEGLLAGWLATLCETYPPPVESDDDEPKTPQGKTKERSKNFEGYAAGQRAQTRYTVSPVGIKDATLRKTGKTIIRASKGRVSVNPRGYPNKKDFSVRIPPSLSSSFSLLQKSLSATGSVLTFAAVVDDAFRLGTASRSDLNRYCAELKNNSSPEMIPEALIKEAGSVAGGWTAGLLGATAGAKAGAMACGTVGAIGGPVGATIGSLACAVGGSIYGGVKAAAYGSQQGGALAEKALNEGVDALVPTAEQMANLPQTVQEGAKVLGAKLIEMAPTAEQVADLGEKAKKLVPTKEQVDAWQATVQAGAQLVGEKLAKLDFEKKTIGENLGELAPTAEQLKAAQKAFQEGVSAMTPSQEQVDQVKKALGDVWSYWTETEEK